MRLFKDVVLLPLSRQYAVELLQVQDAARHFTLPPFVASLPTVLDDFRFGLASFGNQVLPGTDSQTAIFHESYQLRTALTRNSTQFAINFARINAFASLDRPSVSSDPFDALLLAADDSQVQWSAPAQVNSAVSELPILRLAVLLVNRLPCLSDPTPPAPFSIAYALDPDTRTIRGAGDNEHPKRLRSIDSRFRFFRPKDMSTSDDEFFRQQSLSSPERLNAVLTERHISLLVLVDNPDETDTQLRTACLEVGLIAGQKCLIRLYSTYLQSAMTVPTIVAAADTASLGLLDLLFADVRDVDSPGSELSDNKDSDLGTGEIALWASSVGADFTASTASAGDMGGEQSAQTFTTEALIRTLSKATVADTLTTDMPIRTITVKGSTKAFSTFPSVQTLTQTPSIATHISPSTDGTSSDVSRSDTTASVTMSVSPASEEQTSVSLTHSAGLELTDSRSLSLLPSSLRSEMTQLSSAPAQGDQSSLSMSTSEALVLTGTSGVASTSPLFRSDDKGVNLGLIIGVVLGAVVLAVVVAGVIWFMASRGFFSSEIPEELILDPLISLDTGEELPQRETEEHVTSEMFQ